MSAGIAQGCAMVGPTVTSYLNLPSVQWFNYTGAQAWIFSTPENPKSSSVPLVPLFRLSFACNSAQYSNANAATACANNPQHTDTTYTTDQAGEPVTFPLSTKGTRKYESGYEEIG